MCCDIVLYEKLRKSLDNNVLKIGPGPRLVIGGGYVKTLR
jgi:hypothetical protein